MNKRFGHILHPEKISKQSISMVLDIRKCRLKHKLPLCSLESKSRRGCHAFVGKDAEQLLQYIAAWEYEMIQTHN